MKAQLALRMKYRLAAVRKRHYVPHSSGARARAKFQFVVESKQYSLIAGAIISALPQELPHIPERSGGAEPQDAQVET